MPAYQLHLCNGNIGLPVNEKFMDLIGEIVKIEFILYDCWILKFKLNEAGETWMRKTNFVYSLPSKDQSG